MSMCDNCIHDYVCGLEDNHEDGLIFCADMIPKMRWFPVSEKLPKKSGKYWCTFGGTNVMGEDYYTTESDAKKLFDNPEEYDGWRSKNVVAWMPLPESYKAESEDKE